MQVNLKMTPMDPKTTVQAPQKDTHDHWNKVGGLLFAVFFLMFFIVFQIKSKIKKICKWIEIKKKLILQIHYLYNNEKYQWTIPIKQWNKPIRGPNNPWIKRRKPRRWIWWTTRKPWKWITRGFKQVKNNEWWTEEHQGTLSGFPLHISQNIIESINISHSEIVNLSQYNARMREHYTTGGSPKKI